MKQRIISFIAGILVTLIVISLSVFAALPDITWQTLSAAFGGYKVYIDGELFEARDRSGIIEPFNYNGWIWAPFEHIAVALGMNARWEQDTRSLYLDTPPVPPPPKPKVTYFFDVLTAYENTSKTNAWGNITENTSFKMLGDEYIKGWRFSVSGASNFSLSVYYNLRGEYKSIKGILGSVDGTNRDYTGVINIYLDDKLYKEYPMTGNMIPMEVAIDVTSANVMQIKFTSNNNTATYGFGNVIIE